MARISAVGDDDALTTSVIVLIGGPAADLRDDPAVELVAAATGEGGASDGPTGLLGRRDEGWELRTSPGDPSADLGPIVRALVDAARDAGGGDLRWFVPAATDADHHVAAAAGLTATRVLLQMRCPLPLDARASIPTRSFDPDTDRQRWLDVNNRAFDWHPEQGGWSTNDLMAREQQAWFDPDGFRLHEVDGALAGFCWTKVHRDHEPALGEIYVIAVDPAFHGRGLGRQLTLAGLDHLADAGLTVGMLYVEADNAAAVGLYDSLGFTVHQRDIFFTDVVRPS